MKRIYTCIIMLVFSLQLATAAQAEWVVERVSSAVWSSVNGANWSDVRVGESFASSTWIQTGERGQVILARDSERIVFRPGTVATLASQGRNTNVGPIRGSILLSIDPNKRSRTTVETPHLAAVVLGTVFEVTTTPGASSSVRVDQGRVAVKHGGRRAVLERGQEGVVSAGSPSRITIQTASTTSIVPSGSGSALVTEAPSQRTQADSLSTPQINTSDDDGLISSEDQLLDDDGNNGNGSGNNGNGDGTNGNGSGNNGNGDGTNGNGSGNNGNGDDD